MNRLKKAVSDLREYLGRDKEGLCRLEQVASLANEIRKQKALLEGELASARSQLKQLSQEILHAKAQIEEKATALETESSRLRAAALREKRLVESLAKCRQDMEPEPENVGTVESEGHVVLKAAASLSKEVRRRYRRMPQGEYGKQVLALETVVKSHSNDEYMGLGMLVALLALHGLPCHVRARHPVVDMPGWDIEKHSARFLYWYKTWLADNPLHAKIRGPLGTGTTMRIPSVMRPGME